MTREFNITSRSSAGNVHITACGEFNGMCAWELVKTIKKKYKGAGRVFVGTSKLNISDPQGIDMFKALMKNNIMPLNDLYIKGEAGFRIGPDGSRVLISKKDCGNKAPCKQRILKQVSQPR